MPKITLNNQARLMVTIQGLLDAIRLDEKGQPSWDISFDTDARFEILARNVRVEGIENIDSVRTLTRQAILDLKKAAEPTSNNFEATLNRAVQEYLSKPTRVFDVVFVVNISDSSVTKLMPLNLLEVDLRRSEWVEIKKIFEYDKWITEHGNLHIFPEEEFLSFTFTPLIASARGRTLKEGFNNANEAISLFRAILNLVKDYQKQTIAGEPPLGDFLPSPMYGVFDDNGKYLEYYYTLQKYRYQTKQLDEIDVENFSRMVAGLKRSQSNVETMRLTIDALQKYGQALEAGEWREAFLPLWQVLELATLQTERIDMASVAARVKVIFRHNLLINDLVDSLKDARNELVHKGQFSESGIQEVIFLKILVEQVIMFLRDSASYFPTRKHIEWYYTYTPRGDKELEELIKFLEAHNEWRHTERDKKV